jgi:hypothetical protein
VWVIRFINNNEPGESRLRVIAASRNLTFDSSWDTVIRLDEADDGVSLSAVADLFTGLAKNTVSPIPDIHSERVSDLCRDLRTAFFYLPEPFTHLNTHVLGLNDDGMAFPETFDKSIVISPFLSNEFFARVLPRPVDILVSRIDQLPPVDDITAISQRYFFDDGSVSDDEDDTPIGPAEPIRGLHAKIFGFDKGNETHWFLGSANATGAAFRSNVEILLELVGPSSEVGIDQVMGNTGDDLGMWSLFRAYAPSSGQPNDTDVIDQFDSLRRTIASQQFFGNAVESPQGWSVTYSSNEVIETAPGIEAFIWPINDPNARRHISTSTVLDEEFTSSLTDVSGFLAFELRTEKESCSFCVPVLLSGLPTERDTQLMKSLIGNAERFISYLIALLDDTDQYALDDVDRSDAAQQWMQTMSFDTPPVLEKMVKAMRSEPHKLLEIQDLVRDLEQDEILSPEFIDVWNAVLSVAHNGQHT